MYVVNHRTLFFTITGLLLVAAIGSILIFKLPLSIDFTGGSLVEVTYTNARPTIAAVKTDVQQLALGEVSTRESGTKGIVLRTRTLTSEEHTKLLSVLSKNGSVALTEDRFNSIGPALGQELGTKALYGIGAVTLAIMLYIAFAFRRVSRPVPSWGYGIITVLMLAIDIIVPTGFYAAYCHYTGSQVDPLFVVALLALLGYCVNDVIVIFDRVREHLTHNQHTKLVESFDITVGKSITQTLGRSINTALTVVIALLALIFLGGEATRNFALVMVVGVVAGTFSSICRSAPLLIPIAEYLHLKDAAAGTVKKEKVVARPVQKKR
jgi:preprotein translocase subunit SecF